MSSETVFHGSTHLLPPHEVPATSRSLTFHAGTMQAAKDRLDFWAQPGDEPSYIHTYRIDSGVGSDVWGDPIVDEEYNRHMDPEDMRFLDKSERSVPEDDTKTIHPYINEGEHRGSTSYVIPKKMVGSNVKFLGTQFTNWGKDEYGQKVLNVLSGEGRSSKREDWE